MTESNANTRRLRRSYKICRGAFFLISVAMVMLCVDFAAHLALPFAFPILRVILFDDLWGWVLGTLIFVPSVTGMVLLVERWRNPSWRILAGALGAMALMDISLWIFHHGPQFGWFTEDKSYKWMLIKFSMALNWIEFGFMSALALQIWSHLKAVPQQTNADESFQSIAFHDETNSVGYALKLSDTDPERVSIWMLPAIGLAFWVVTFIHMSDWRKGWPIQQRNLPDGEVLPILLVETILGMIVAFRVNHWCQFAMRRCAWEIEELKKHEAPEEDHSEISR